MNRKKPRTPAIPKPLNDRDALIERVLFSSPYQAMQERLLIRLIYLSNTQGKVKGMAEHDLAALMNVSDRSIRTALSALQRVGVIAPLKRPSTPQSGDVMEYEIRPAVIRQVADAYFAHRAEWFGPQDRGLRDASRRRKSGDTLSTDGTG